MRVKEKTTTTYPGESLVGLSNLFFNWNFFNRLIKTFLQINLFVACRHRTLANLLRLIDFSQIEKRVRFLAPCGSRIVKFLIHDWFIR